MSTLRSTSSGTLREQAQQAGKAAETSKVEVGTAVEPLGEAERDAASSATAILGFMPKSIAAPDGGSTTPSDAYRLSPGLPPPPLQPAIPKSSTTNLPLPRWRSTPEAASAEGKTKREKKGFSP
jgi:hypothetical protein